MKIQKVIIKDFKSIHNLEAEINGNNIILLGDNGVGKSSFIQFIEIALGKNTNIPLNAQGKGEIVTDRAGQEYIFKVEFKNNKPVVTVTSPDGLKDNRKSAIQNIVGTMEFDIDEFVNLAKTPAGRKKQVDIFKSFLPEEVRIDLAKYEANIKVNYDNRTEANRILKEKQGAIISNPLNNETDLDSFESVDVKSELTMLTEAREHNDKVNGVVSRKKLMVEALNKEISEINELKEKLGKIILSSTEKKQKLEDAEKWLTQNTIKPTESFEKSINSATEKNNKYKDAQELKKQIALAKTIQNDVEGYTSAINAEKEMIAEAIRSVDSPISGLGFDDEQLIYNGTAVSPDNLSSSEIMELGIRLKMVENTDLGILFIQRGESLGEARLKEIIAIADKAGWQIIMEQVQRGTEELTIEIMSA